MGVAVPLGQVQMLGMEVVVHCCQGMVLVSKPGTRLID